MDRKKAIKITVLGDIMLKSDMVSSNYDYIFRDIKGYLNKSDYVMANLETPISKNKPKLKKYSFISPYDFAKAIKSAGVDFVSTANNHCLDNGIKGIDETIDCLDELGVDHDGTYKDAKQLFTKTINGKKVGIVAYTYGTNAFANNIYLNELNRYKINLTQRQELSSPVAKKIYQSNNILAKIMRKFFIKKPVYERNEKSYFKNLLNDIAKIKSMSDYCIVMLHDGGQNNERPIKRIKKECKKLFDVGADAIICNHEHMIHPIIKNGDQLATYSIGNFTGNSGVTEGPFDKMQEYSVGMNIYLGNSGVEYSYVFFKNVLCQDGKIRVKLLSDIIEQEKNQVKKKALMYDLEKLQKKVQIAYMNKNGEYFI